MPGSGPNIADGGPGRLLHHLSQFSGKGQVAFSGHDGGLGLKDFSPRTSVQASPVATPIMSFSFRHVRSGIWDYTQVFVDGLGLDRDGWYPLPVFEPRPPVPLFRQMEEISRSRFLTPASRV